MSTAFGWDDLYVGIAAVALSAVVILNKVLRKWLTCCSSHGTCLALALFVMFANLEKPQMY